MSDEKKPDPIEDLRKGLGLLFRAAKTVASELPRGKLEEVVATGVREVGRAVGSVASTIEREVFGHRPADDAKPADAEAEEAKAEQRKADDTKPHDAKSDDASLHAAAPAKPNATAKPDARPADEKTPDRS